MTPAEAHKLARQNVKAHLTAIHNKIHNMPPGYHFSTLAFKDYAKLK